MRTILRYSLLTHCRTPAFPPASREALVWQVKRAFNIAGHTPYLFLFALLCLACADAPNPSDESLSVGGDFTHTDHTGHTYRLKDHPYPSLLFFGYARCPDYCPQTLAKVARASALLGDDARSLRILFISVDPDHDPPETLKTYLSNFDLPAIGLTGSPDSLDAVVKRYGAFYETTDQQSAAGPLINHSLYLYLIDRHGNVRHFFHSTDTPETIAEIVRQLLKE